MRKTINCKPVDEIELVNGEDSILLRFDTRSTIALQELAQSKNLDMEQLFKMDQMALVELIIYCSAKYNNDDMTEDKAREFAGLISVADMMSIIDTYAKSIGDIENIDQNDLLKKVMAQFNKMKS